VNARASVEGSTVVNFFGVMVEVQAVIGHLRSKLQTLADLGTDAPSPVYVQ
jgi:hypothetical protein